MPPVRRIDHAAPAGLLALAVVALAGCQSRADAVERSSAGGSEPRVVASPPAATCGPSEPAAGELDLAAIVARAAPTVVSVRGSHVPDPGELSPGGGPPSAALAVGSGVLISEDGLVLTSDHVVEDASGLAVRLADDRRFEATVVGRDPRLDVALLRLLGAQGLPVAPLGSSASARVGDRTIVIGNPFGLGPTVTVGIVSATSRAIGLGSYGFLQTDAAINPGNSGGPVFNAAGQVVGLATAIHAEGRGIGFAVPIDEVREVLPDLQEKGRVERGRMGIGFQEVTDELARALRMPERRGALVTEVAPRSPAARAGLRPGDVVTSMNAVRIDHAQELARALGRGKPGEEIAIGYRRDGEERAVGVRLEVARPPPPRRPSGARMTGLGLSVSDAPGGARIDAVDPRSAASSELQAGDLILEVNGAEIHGGADFASRLRAAPRRTDVLVRLRREGAPRFVVIQAP